MEEIKSALSRQLLPKPDPEKPEKCELHRFITSRAPRFRSPQSPEGWAEHAAELRQRFVSEVYLRGHESGLTDLPPNVVWRDVIDDMPGYRIRKLVYEGFPGMWIPALLYEPLELEGKAPAVLNPNGHHTGGKAMQYKQARCINLAKRGMLALSTEFIGMGELTMNVPHNRIGHMDLCGKSGVAIFYLAVKRGLDVLLSHPNCDSQRVAVTGLSGGGWQTIVLGALDERVKVIVPVAGHSPVWQRPSCISDIGDLEQTPVGLCTVADFDTLTALCAPRPILLIYNEKDDCCFRPDRTRVSIYDPVRPLYSLLGVPQRIKFYVNEDPGTHNYDADNRRQLYAFLDEHFGLETPEGDLPFEDELLSESQLEVGLPEENEDLLSLAKRSARGLPRMRLPSGPEPEVLAWKTTARERLAEVIRLRKYELVDEMVSSDTKVSHHILRLGGTWSMPATVFKARAENPKTQVLLSDSGRATLAASVESHLAAGRKVVATDVFSTGELPYPARYQMMVSTVGERPLGILVGQLLSLSDWASRGSGPIRASATGPITSFGILCAAALRPDLFAHLFLEGLYDSLKRLIELPVEYDNAVPLFCFGLLEALDVPELLALAEVPEIERPSHGPVLPIAAKPQP